MGFSSARRIRALLAFGAVALGLGGLPAHALADGFLTADYSGTWDEAFVFDKSNPAVGTESLHFVWDERESAHVFGGTPSGVATVKVLSRTLTITGTISEVFGPPNQNVSCAGTFSIRRPHNQFPMSVLPGETSDPPMEVAAIVPLGGDYSQTSAGGMCAYGRNGGAGISQGNLTTNHYTVPLTPLFMFKLSRRSYTKTFKTLDRTSAGDAQTAVSSIFRAATANNKPPDLPPPPPLATPVRDQVKRNALNALRASVVQALYPCGVGVGVGATILGAGPVGLAAGAALLTVGAPLCQTLLSQIVAEEKTYKDPPRPDYLLVAHVGAASRLVPRAAGCSRFNGAAGTLCTRVAVAASGVRAAVRQTEAVAAALEATVGRDTAAANAHNQAAVGLQEQALRTLSAQFAAARRAQANAGSGLQAALRSGPVSVRVSVAQFKRDAKALLRAAARKRVSANTLRRLAAGALRPRRLDPIAAY